MTHKKLITACMALFALAAFALPAAAQAANHPLLTENGKALAVGSKITATNVGETLLVDTTASEGIELRCTKASMTGELTSNTTGNVQGNITAASFTGTGSGGACTGTFLNPTIEPITPWCLKSNEEMGEDEFQVRGGKCSEAAKTIKFVLHVAGGECVYESTGTTAVKGTYTTEKTGDALMSTPRAGHTANEDAGFKKVKDTVLFEPCPKSSALHMTFTLETDSATVEPLTISE